MPSEASSVADFTNSGKRSALGNPDRAAAAEHGELRRRDTVVGEHLLRQHLVARKHHAARIAAGVRLAQQLEPGDDVLVVGDDAVEFLEQVEADLRLPVRDAPRAAPSGCRRCRSGARRGRDSRRQLTTSYSVRYSAAACSRTPSSVSGGTSVSWTRTRMRRLRHRSGPAARAARRRAAGPRAPRSPRRARGRRASPAAAPTRRNARPRAGRRSRRDRRASPGREAAASMHCAQIAPPSKAWSADSSAATAASLPRSIRRGAAAAPGAGRDLAHARLQRVRAPEARGRAEIGASSAALSASRERAGEQRSEVAHRVERQRRLVRDARRSTAASIAARGMR